MDKDSKIAVLGHSGMLGHALCSRLTELGYHNLACCSSRQVDLCDPKQTQAFFQRERPEFVFFVAALAASIEFKKTHPVEILRKNLQMITNAISAAYDAGCTRMINVCSALVYPSEATIPLKEEAAVYCNLNLIDTPYSLAKAAGMQLSRYYNQEYHTNYITVVPCNFFGAFAPFDRDRAGVVPSLIRRIHEAKEEGSPTAVVWGTGYACRELLNSRDVADACVFLMEQEQQPYDLVNVGRGHEFTIREVAQMIQKIVGYEGELVFDATKPEGRQHMQMDTTRLFSLGWAPKMNLEESIQDTYAWYLSTLEANKG